jgi:hypothetical protein
MVANGSLHCNGGWILGDIAAERLVLVAYVFGIAFQYFTIAPMRGLPFGKGVIAAIKAVRLING